MALKTTTGALALLATLAGCGKLEKLIPGVSDLTGGEAGGQLAPIGNVSRAAIEKSGGPVMKLRVPSRGIETFLTIRDRRGDVTQWFSADGMLFSFRGDILIETRGLGADLMSSAAPQAGQIASGGAYRRSYFYMDADDQTGRRDYNCVTTTDGSETVTIYGRGHSTRKISETCEREGGRLTNHYWLEGGKVRKSREWVSPGIGQIEFERVVD
ncbi:YjbF family lipoprotein [Gemmobacter sp. 24YEA27]|uniref:YjbF family lipoprotein n=1 Tax=Gemmobacter sp. 24YEA27 TaxID=3040672 RepID=UPI0024B347A5|nr:YjbF family lipoprotein [Gemmobacter sp. 24YEA27]